MSYPNDHRFSHNFQNCINTLCSCDIEVESIIHFFLHCLHYDKLRSALLNTVKKFYGNITFLSESEAQHSLLKKMLIY